MTEIKRTDFDAAGRRTAEKLAAALEVRRAQAATAAAGTAPVPQARSETGEKTPSYSDVQREILDEITKQRNAGKDQVEYQRSFIRLEELQKQLNQFAGKEADYQVFSDNLRVERKRNHQAFISKDKAPKVAATTEPARATRPTTPEPAPAATEPAATAEIRPPAETIPEPTPATPESATAAAPVLPENIWPAESEMAFVRPAQTEAEHRARQQEMKLKLDEARTMYMRMKKEDTEAHSFMAKFTGKSKDQIKILAALQQVETDYKKAYAEYLAVTAEDFMLEKDRLADEQARLLSHEHEPGKFTKFYRRLGETSILGTQNYQGPFKRTVKFLTSNRTLINGALIGAAIVSGPGGWIAGGALVSRRLMSGFGSGLASRDLVKSARTKNLIEKEIPIYSNLTDIEDYLQAMRARSALDGTMDKLASNKNYQVALELRRTKVKNGFDKESFEQLSPEEKLRYITEMLDLENDKLDEKIEHEKKWNRLALYAGVAVGVLVGSGTAARMIRGAMEHMPNMGIMDWWHNHVSGPLAGSHEATAAATSGAATEAAQAHAHETVLTVGNRGIEGAMLDLKGTNPAEYQAMMQNLHHAFPGYNGSDAGLIDHAVREAGHSMGANVDMGGGNDLSKIFGTHLTIDSHGVHLGDTHFMPAQAAAEAHSALTDQAHEHATQGGLGTHHVDFSHPDADHGLTGGAHHAPVFNHDLHHGAETNPAGAHSTDVQADDSGDSGPTKTPDTGMSVLEQSRLDNAMSASTTSKALKILLENDGYRKFTHQVGLSDKLLDKIQDMKLNEFLKQYYADPESSFHKSYAKLAHFLGEKINGQDFLTSGDSGKNLRSIIFSRATLLKK